MKHLNLKVSGEVQGVYFRDYTQKEAKALGLSGWVRNEPDGTVYIEVEGEQQALEKFKAWVQHGPARAEVKRVMETEGEVLDFKDFTVRR